MKLAMMGEDFIHDYIYPGALNGFDKVLMQKEGGWMADMHHDADGYPMDEDIQVSVIVSSNLERARSIARACHINRVEPKLSEALIDELDGVLIMERDGSLHLNMARSFIERGKFVYIDKPVVQKLSELDELRELALSSGAKVLGGSAVRYSAQMSKALKRIEEVPAVSVHIAGPGPWYEYGSHMVEALVILFGHDIAETVALGSSESGAVIVRWTDGRHGVIQYGRGDYPPGFTIQLFGQEQMFQTNLDDPVIYYRGVSKRIVDVLEDKQPPSNWAELYSITKVMEQVGEQVSGR